jgi:SAM-dependent methyltransferase
MARGAAFCGVDFSSAMIERARARHPAVTFEVGDAESLPFPDASFDAVVMNFGMLHLARPERAMAESARVLRPGRRFAFTVWDKPEATVAFGLVLNAIRTLGNPDVPLPPGPPFFRYSEASECERSLRQAGFVDIRITRVPQIWQFETPEAPFHAIYNGGVRIKAMLKAQTDEARAAIREAVCQGARRFLCNGAVELPMPAVLASAARA